MILMAYFIPEGPPWKLEITMVVGATTAIPVILRVLCRATAPPHTHHRAWLAWHCDHSQNTLYSLGEKKQKNTTTTHKAFREWWQCWLSDPVASVQKDSRPAEGPEDHSDKSSSDEYYCDFQLPQQTLWYGKCIFTWFKLEQFNYAIIKPGVQI